TETMLLGTSCAEGTVHLETGLVHCELAPVDGRPEARLLVTTLAVRGSPLVRFDTGDVVRVLPNCACGDLRPGIAVPGRAPGAGGVGVGGGRVDGGEWMGAGAAAADALDSSVFFVVVLPDRILVRVEVTSAAGGDPLRAARTRLADIAVEIERVSPGMLLDVE